MLLVAATWLTPLRAWAQIDDPGVGEPTPSRPPVKTEPVKTTPPPVKTEPAPTKLDSTRTLEPTFVEPVRSGAPTVTEDVKEEVSTSATATLSDDEWEHRLAAPNLLGTIGLFHMHTAEAGLPLNFRVGSHMQGFTQNSFLIGQNALNPGGDSNARFLGDLTIGLTGPDVVFLRGLELYLGFFNSSNENKRIQPGRTDPAVILSLGDVGIGLKGAWNVVKGFNLGGHIGVRFYNSISGQLANFDATTASFDVLAGLDVRKWAPKVPLRFHFNAGFFLDNSLSLLPKGQCAGATTLSDSASNACISSRVVETFAYGLGTSRMRFALAVELPIRPHVPWGIFGVAPFVEYHLDVAVGTGDPTVEKVLRASNIAESRITNPITQYLTVGLRFRPVARFVLDMGAEFNLQSPGFKYGPPVPQYNIIIGAAYTYDPAGSSTKLIKRTITRTVEVATKAPEGHVRGIVRDAKTKKPIAGAVIKYPGRGNLTSQLAGDDGTFYSYGLAPGSVKVEASSDDHEPAAAMTNLDANVDVSLEILLTAKPPKEGKVKLHAVDEKGVAVVGGSAHFVGPVTRDGAADGDSFLVALPPGDYAASLDAPGYLAKEKQVTVVTNQQQTVELVLRKRPLKPSVTLTKDEIVTKPIHFGTGNAVILPDGQQLLDEVVDVLAKHTEIRKVSIEGHTDNRGIPAKNQKLSQDRAQAVQEYLVKQGIAADRVASAGYGASKPKVPNLTAANRAKNRRVDFKIVDQGSPVN